MENYQLKRMKPMAYALILASLAAVAVPAGQSLLIPEPVNPATSTTATPESPLISAPAKHSPSVSLDGMMVDSILRPHPVTEVVA